MASLATPASALASRVDEASPRRVAVTVETRPRALCTLGPSQLRRTRAKFRTTIGRHLLSCSRGLKNYYKVLEVTEDTPQRYVLKLSDLSAAPPKGPATTNVLAQLTIAPAPWGNCKVRGAGRLRQTKGTRSFPAPPGIYKIDCHYGSCRWGGRVRVAPARATRWSKHRRCGGKRT